MTVEERNVFIYQNSAFSESFDNPEGSPGDVVSAQLRRWPGAAALMATFSTAVSTDGETVRIELDADSTRQLTRSGYYDVFVNGRVLASGFAKFRYNVTLGNSPSARKTWGLLKYTKTTWKQLRQRRIKWRDL